jgi:hypothetical protein
MNLDTQVAIEGGATDVLPDSQLVGGFKVVADAGSFGAVRDALEAAGVAVDSERSGLSMSPVTLIEVSLLPLPLRRPRSRGECDEQQYETVDADSDTGGCVLG